MNNRWIAGDLYTVNISYANFGIIVDGDEIVLQAAPIAKWMVGKRLGDVVAWIESKAGKIEKVDI